MVELGDSLSELLLHRVIKHLDVVRTTSSLNFSAVESAFNRHGIGWPVQSVNKTIFAFVKSNRTYLNWIQGDSRLVYDAIQLNQVLEVTPETRLAWLFLCLENLLQIVSQFSFFYFTAWLRLLCKSYLISHQYSRISNHTVIEICSL